MYAIDIIRDDFQLKSYNSHVVVSRSVVYLVLDSTK